MRIGSAEVYRTVETFPEIAESLVVCIKKPGGGYHMPLFVEMAPGATVNDDLAARLLQRLRSERSPRHVSDEIREAPTIPMTPTVKKMEVPVRKLLFNMPAGKVASRDATRNPEALDWFAAERAGA